MKESIITERNRQILAGRRRQLPDQPVTGAWTLGEVRTIALGLGKEFNPNPDISGRLENDLSRGAIVLFTEDDVTQARDADMISSDQEPRLMNLVSRRGKNDVAVVLREPLRPSTYSEQDMDAICGIRRELTEPPQDRLPWPGIH